MASEKKFNPLGAPGDYFTSPIHQDPYPAIDSAKVNLNGKAVVIAGASRGIGKAIAISFAKAGASKIAIGARSNLTSVAEAMLAAAKSAGKPAPRILQLKLDMRSAENLSSAAAEVEKAFGRVDVLLNNAGILGTRDKIADSDPDEWWDVWEINLRGPYLAMRAFLPLMLKGGDKTIINTGSVGAWLNGPGLSMYQPSKLAILRLADFVDAEYKDQGVVCYTIHPGNCLTDIVGGESGVNPSMKHLFHDKPELAADTIVFLTKERPEWLSGRYISATWDMPEIMRRKDEIVSGNKLKIIMSL